MTQHHKIDYVEFPSADLARTKAFFTKVFAWEFQDYGPEYAAFSGSAGLTGGFYHAPLKASTETGSALIVFFSDDIDATQAAIEKAGGEIVKPIFDFPGGRRFHFTEPSGNEFAVWALPANA